MSKDRQLSNKIEEVLMEKGQQRLVKAAKLDATPSELAKRLKSRCLGQDDIVDTVAVKVYQHLARCRAYLEGERQASHLHVPPSLLIGPSGCGKSTLMQAISRITSLPIYTADATNLTEAGYKGESVDDWIDGLVRAAGGYTPLAEFGILIVDEIDKCRSTVGGHERDVSGTGAQTALLQIAGGGQVSLQETGIPLQIRTDGMLIVAAGAFNGLEAIVRDRLSVSDGSGFGFTTQGALSDVPMGDLMQMITPQDLIEFGLKRELVGRFERIMVMSPLSDDALRDILCDACVGPIQTQQQMAASLGCRFNFSDNLISLMISEARESGLGARGLWGLVDKATERAWYELPARREREQWDVATVRFRTDSLTDGYYSLSSR